MDLTGGTVRTIMASEETTGIPATSPVALSKAKITGFDTSVEGPKTITVSYEGFTKTFSINVTDNATGISIISLPTKTDYLYGEELDLTGGQITLVKESGNGEPIDITRDMITGYEPTKLGKQTLTITYKGFEKEFDVYVEDYVDKLKVTPPTKTAYEYGESLKLDGGKVEIVMASGAIQEENPITFSMFTNEFNNKQTGKQTINLEYKDLTGSFTVSVEDKVKAIAMNSNPDKTEYEYGESLDVTGATIKVTKSSGTYTIPVTKDMTSGYNARNSGTQVVKVTYGGFETEFVVTVKAKPAEPSKPTEPVTPTEPTEPVEPTDPTIPTEPVEPTEPTTPTEPVEPTEPTNPTEPTSPTKPTTPTKPSNPSGDKTNNPSTPDGKNTTNPNGTNTSSANTSNDSSSQDNESTTPVDSNSEDNTTTPVDDSSDNNNGESEVTIKKPTATLGDKDEDDSISGETVAGIIGGIGILLLLILLIMRRNNVKIYVEENGEYELGGLERLTKKNTEIDVDKCLDGETYQNKVKIYLKKSISKKLDGKEVEIKHRNETIKYTIKYEDEAVEIVLE